jgi:3-methyladenine DNA glycosylase AlkD
MFAALEAAFQAHADPERARQMAAYMRDQFAFYGLPSPLRRELCKPFRRGRPDFESAVRALWSRPEREWRYFALELAEASRRYWTPATLDLWRFMVVTDSWWDTVDCIASRLVGGLLRSFPQLTPAVDGWLDEEDFWLQRTALLHQLGYKEKTDPERLFGAARKLAGSEEFFLRKAIGWALRQYSYVDPEAVTHFVEHTSMSNLSRREALKAIQRRASPTTR